MLNVKKQPIRFKLKIRDVDIVEKASNKKRSETSNPVAELGLVVWYGKCLKKYLEEN